jgi:hypothetical protein
MRCELEVEFACLLSMLASLYIAMSPPLRHTDEDLDMQSIKRPRIQPETFHLNGKPDLHLDFGSQHATYFSPPSSVNKDQERLHGRQSFLRQDDLEHRQPLKTNSELWVSFWVLYNSAYMQLTATLLSEERYRLASTELASWRSEC